MSEIRKAIAEYARSEIQPGYEEIVNSVAKELNVSQGAVRDELDALEANGFVYIVENEVRLA